MKYSEYKIIIVGSGISGLYVALKLAQNTDFQNKILLVTKSELGESNSKYAQGGIVAVLKDNPNDSVESHINDTLKAGAGLSELNSIKFISENSDKVIRDLLNFGVEFDCDENGKMSLTLEAAHSVKRILHSGGDATGRRIEEALKQKVLENKNIKIYENRVVTDLLYNGESCCGAVLFDGEDYEVVSSSATILATGGIGHLYKYTTNPKGATGDGIALAYKIGAKLQDMEFVQFHPTALAIDDDENRFLISEAVRGEGAKLVNSDGIEFMSKYHEKLELAPRDIVTRANYFEMQKTNSDCVFLDATHIDKSKLEKRFPTIIKKCLKSNIDISNDLIPIAPAAHYFMGGIKTNLYGETSVKGLYAIGEVASTGLHGANRLASNSLLECVVCAFNLSKYLSENDFVINNDVDYELPQNEHSKGNDNIDVDLYKKQLQEIMWNNVGIYRNEVDLKKALAIIDDLSHEFECQACFQTFEEFEFKNMLLVAKLITESALSRKESRGAHYRTDYLSTCENAVHSIIDKNKEMLNVIK